MTPLETLGAILLTAFGIAVALFRRYYMPSMPSTDHLDTFPPEPYIPSSVPPIMAPTVTETKTVSKLKTFCEAIRDYEGGPGDANYRNCNPGNFRCSPVGYFPKYGNVRCSPAGFAIFPTYALGWEYLNAQVLSRANKHPEWTILDFFNNYAPSSENDPTAYARFVAKRCGVDIHATVKSIVV